MNNCVSGALCKYCNAFYSICFHNRLAYPLHSRSPLPCNSLYHCVASFTVSLLTVSLLWTNKRNIMKYQTSLQTLSSWRSVSFHDGFNWKCALLHAWTYTATSPYYPKAIRSNFTIHTAFHPVRVLRPPIIVIIRAHDCYQKAYAGYYSPSRYFSIARKL